MNDASGAVVAVIATCVLSSSYGHWRRHSGRAVTARDRVLVMGVAWAVFWVSLPVPHLVTTNVQHTWSGLGFTTPLFYLAFAAGPLLLFLVAAYLPPLFAGPRGTRKEKTEPHPLD